VFDLFPRLAELRHRRVALLSGGEQQMLSVARAVARRPRLLMVDELSLGLAPMVVQQILTILRTIADAGCGVLLVEQHVHFALSVADRAYVLSNGKLALSGEAAALDHDSAALHEAYFGERA
jgi:branched-chain amino acid transport system ATP-binding protein